MDTNDKVQAWFVENKEISKALEVYRVSTFRVLREDGKELILEVSDRGEAHPSTRYSVSVQGGRPGEPYNPSDTVEGALGNVHWRSVWLAPADAAE